MDRVHDHDRRATGDDVQGRKNLGALEPKALNQDLTSCAAVRLPSIVANANKTLPPTTEAQLKAHQDDEIRSVSRGEAGGWLGQNRSFEHCFTEAVNRPRYPLSALQLQAQKQASFREMMSPGNPPRPFLPPPAVMDRLKNANDIGDANRLYNELWTQIKSK